MAADIKERQKKALDAYKESTSSGGSIDKNRFNVKIFQYPSDLQTAPNLKHYILFNINIRGKSKFNADKVQFEVKKNPNSANLSPDQLASGPIRTTTALAAGATAGVAVSALVKGAAKSFGLTGGKNLTTAQRDLKEAAINTGANLTGAAAAVAVGGAVAASAILKPDTTYRISDAIALYVDGPPTVKYSMNYANKELGTLLGVLSGSVIDGAGFKAGSVEAGAAIGATLAKLPGAFGAADIASALSVSTGTALNPFRETVFESVDFRSFAFKYKFYPKNKRESDDVHKIIETFKFHMHPEMSAGKLFFIYPSEFNITYYFGNDENGYFHRFATCVLENMDVSYGGEQFSSFRDGSPTEINMSLTFRELEILTKNMISEGY
jgi:hypothetical protein